MPQQDFNAWMKMLNINGDQQNPAVMSQMASQATSNQAPTDEPGVPPQVMSPMPQNVPLTKQPTMTPPGYLPQELKPSQPALTSSSNNPMYQYAAMMAQMNPAKANPLLDQQMRVGEKNYNDSMNEQMGDLENQKELAAKYASSDRGTDFRPLAALVDSLFGGGGAYGKAAEGMAPESAAAKAINQASMAKAISASAGSLSADQLSYLKQKLLQQNYIENRDAKEDLVKQNNATKLATGSGRVGVAQDRLAAQAANTFDNDEIIKQAQKQSMQIGIDTHTLQNATVLTPQIFNEVQQGLANAISGGKGASVTSQNNIEFDSVNNQLKRLQQRIENKPEDINSPEVKQMMIDTLGRLDNAYKNNAYARAQQIRSGRDKVYSNNPIARDVMDEKVNSYKPAAPAPATSAPKVGDIVDGHQFLGGNPADPASWKAQ